MAQLKPGSSKHYGILGKRLQTADVRWQILKAAVYALKKFHRQSEICNPKSFALSTLIRVKSLFWHLGRLKTL